MLLKGSELQQLEKYLKPNQLNFLLIAENANLDCEQLIAFANANGISIVGGIFPKIIHGLETYDDALVLQYLDPSSEVIISKDLNDSKFEVNLPDLAHDIHSGIVLVDGLMANIPRFLERLYEKYWNHIKFIGAGCGSLTLQQRPCLLTNEGFFQNGALLIMRRNELSLGVKHGWEKLYGPIIANSTSGNALKELQWKPAFDMYKEALKSSESIDISPENFFDVAKSYPFGILREEEEFIVRDPIAVGSQNSLQCVGEISQNASVYILKGEKDQLINSASEAAALANASAQGDEFFIVDCISRVLFLGDSFRSEIEAIHDQLTKKQPEKPVSGVLSLGEICSSEGGFLELLNKTVVVGAFD